MSLSILAAFAAVYVAFPVATKFVVDIAPVIWLFADPVPTKSSFSQKSANAFAILLVKKFVMFMSVLFKSFRLITDRAPWEYPFSSTDVNLPWPATRDVNSSPWYATFTFPVGESASESVS